MPWKSTSSVSSRLHGLGRRRCYRLVVFLLFGLAICVYSLKGHLQDNHEQEANVLNLRHPLQYGSQEKENCTLSAIQNFPKDLFTQPERRHGAVLVHFFVAMYMFWAIAVCCDSYFVPSLEEMCDRLGLQTDVAGATLMAIGSSAPELFAAIIGVFITKGDIGIGTILGSAVFNVLFVIGACGLFSGTVLILAWWPLTRDAVCYGISLFVLTIVIFDGEVRWFEALAMVLLYPMYVVLMYFNASLERKLYEYIGDEVSIRRRFYTKCKDEEWNDLLQEYDDGTPENANDYQMMEMVKATKDEDGSKTENGDGQDDDACKYGKDLFEVPSGVIKIAAWILQLPITTIFFLTIPNVKNEKCRKLYVLGFIISILWIGILTYVLVWMVTVAGFTVGISDTVMGLTFVAFGSSVPDCLSSLLVARQGDGDMAVSHTIGSNVFDILLCLGVPWLFKTVAMKTREPVAIRSQGLFISCFVILGSLLFAMVVIIINKWKLSVRIGLLFVLAYLFFLLIAIIVEIYVFGSSNPPLCPLA